MRCVCVYACQVSLYAMYITEGLLLQWRVRVSNAVGAELTQLS